MNINVFQEFSAANFLAGKMRKTWGRNVEHWETLKDRGNDALKRGDLQSAAELYHQSALSTLGPNQSGIADAFTEVLASWPPDSSRKQLSECTDVLALIMRKLPRPLEDETVTDGSGDAQQALASARRATKANPEYVKGHYREMRALESLGDSAAAAEIKEEISDYERCRRIFPAEGIALMAVGWISLAQLSFIYMPVRQREALRCIHKALGPDIKRVELRASIVPFLGGQALMTIVIGGPFGEVKVEGFTFAIVDSQNGDIADAPPNGHASAQALTLAPEQIDATVHMLQRSGLVVAAVMCGQGLKQHSAAIHRRLADLQLAREPAGAQAPAVPFVYAADSTAASEDSGVPIPFIASPDAMHATMLRRGSQ